MISVRIETDSRSHPDWIAVEGNGDHQPTRVGKKCPTVPHHAGVFRTPLPEPEDDHQKQDEVNQGKACHVGAKEERVPSDVQQKGGGICQSDDLAIGLWRT